ncbi:MAG: 1,4-dihydroxy-6-naphthoate synthase [Opitutales bacterium]|nr:1,4-dihydroxy-6-naphthoate synthase [Opitutales bacterium]
MKFAITPCPNDTFSYFAMIDGKTPSFFDFVFDDIEGLNLSAKSGEYEVTKMSFATYLENSKTYELLDAGAALGIGTGPVLVGKKGIKFDIKKPIAVPGLNTTAALLLKFFCLSKLDLRPMYFRDIAECVAQTDIDYGVLIHEGRFVYEQQGLELLEDLGEFWTKSTSLPVPLGCICIRRDLIGKKEEIENQIRQSIRWAFDNPKSTIPYVKSMAQYLQDDVLQKHIYAFVNEYSLDISSIRTQLLENLQKCHQK